MNEDTNNSTKPKKKNDHHNCCVPQCSELKNDSNLLHRFPQDPALKKKWIDAIKTGKKVSDNMRVCRRHFKKDDYIKTIGTGKKLTLKKGVIPTENLTKKLLDKEESSPAKRRKAARADRSIKRARRFSLPLSDPAG